MTLEQALAAAVVSLAGCVGALFAWFKGQFALVVSKLNDCETDREALWERIAGLAEGKKDKTEHFTTSPIQKRK